MGMPGREQARADRAATWRLIRGIRDLDDRSRTALAAPRHAEAGSALACHNRGLGGIFNRLRAVRGRNAVNDQPSKPGFARLSPARINSAD